MANPKENTNQENNMSKDEQIGFHKGAVNTLVAERNELLKMVNITEQLISAHIKALESLGIKLEQKRE